ncbi:DUF7693 family protein [Pseudomonas protegens]|uniref:DUF7693 family protein n=1 Tax=Pseudomonas protegens TaxID=380021 RepID=UPI00200C771E|nr:hypothetical protein [Pseudomonas protegens]
MPCLNARDVCQRLRDAALGVSPLRPSADQPGAGQVQVDIEGWQLLLDFDGQHLHHCQRCRSAEGDAWQLDTRQRFGTDPVSLLSTWELAQIETLLKEVD